MASSQKGISLLEVVCGMALWGFCMIGILPLGRDVVSQYQKAHQGRNDREELRLALQFLEEEIRLAEKVAVYVKDIPEDIVKEDVFVSDSPFQKIVCTQYRSSAFPAKTWSLYCKPSESGDLALYYGANGTSVLITDSIKSLSVEYLPEESILKIKGNTNAVVGVRQWDIRYKK